MKPSQEDLSKQLALAQQRQRYYNNLEEMMPSEKELVHIYGAKKQVTELIQAINKELLTFL